MDFLDILLDTDFCSSYTTNSKKLDRTGRFYHVTQQCYSFGNTFSLNSAKYRTHLLHEICRKNKVIVLCSIVMPTHTHDVFYSSEFSNIQHTVQAVNTAVSKYISKERNYSKKEPVFADLPSYERISDKSHLFYLFKYLYENPQYLKKEGKHVPYSCFDQWEKNYFKPYKTEAYKLLFNKELSEIVQMCMNMSKEEFFKESERLYYGQGI